ncbi:hypothetical protein COU59_01440 [Candidatus Pacearchaeota archaeon CG10_big_fil_rev_8_21_14_0_10_34_12]|nr:MAG: hypothetical protein COU59_01440 [Candidatus Pacearchaeota archaeon CG10_big_fil_rev_8_21_14_0_10_34_12]
MAPVEPPYGIPPGSYTEKTLPEMSEGARRIGESVMRLAEKFYAERGTTENQPHVRKYDEKPKLRLTDQPKSGIKLTDFPRK